MAEQALLSALLRLPRPATSNTSRTPPSRKFSSRINFGIYALHIRYFAHCETRMLPGRANVRAVSGQQRGNQMKKALLVSGAVVLALASQQVSAAFVENFDSYANQAQFEAAWRPYSADNSSMQLSFDGHSGNGVHGVAATNYHNRNARDLDNLTEYKGTDDSPVVFEFWINDTDTNLPASPAGARNFCELRAFAGDGIPAYSAGNSSLQGLIAMGMYNTPISDDHYHARVYYGGVSSWFSLNTSRQAGWHKLSAEIGSSWVKFLVDDQLDTTVSLQAGTNRLFAFDGVVLGSGLTSGGYDVGFDDLSVSRFMAAAVPEPSALVFLGLGAALFLRKPRRVV